jgi:hypothetical protein
MLEMLNAHLLTVVIIIASIMVTPFYILAVYVFSGASALKGLQVGTAFLIWGALMVWVCLNQIPAKLGIGMADFLSAFFFGFTSTQGPLQLFFPDVPNRLIMFPTGMITLFLVPYAIFFLCFPCSPILNFNIRVERTLP